MNDREPTVDEHTIPWGSVVASLPWESDRFLGSPSVVVLPDGTHVVSHDVFGTDAGVGTSYVYRSPDGTGDWE